MTRSLNDNPLPLGAVLHAPVRQDTPWPSAGSLSENLFETMKDWPIPSTPVPTPAPTIRTEEQPKTAAIKKSMEKRTVMVIYKINQCIPKTFSTLAPATASATTMARATKPSVPPVTEQLAVI